MRNHKEMAAMAALITKGTPSGFELVPTPATRPTLARTSLATSEASWENEGGALRPSRRN